MAGSKTSSARGWVIAGVTLVVAPIVIYAGIRVGNQEQTKNHLAMGAEYAKDGAYDKSVAEYEAALEANKTSAATWLALGNVQAKATHWTEALAAYNEVHSLNPKYPHIYSMMAISADQGKNPLKAYEYAEDALKVDPNDIDALVVEIPLMRDAGYAVRDQDHIKRLVKLQPDNVLALSLLTNVLITEENFDEAKPYAAHLVQLKPDDPDNQFYDAVARAEGHTTPDELAKSVTVLKGLVDQHPTYYLGHRFLGRAYMHQGNWKAAAAELGRAAKLRPNRKELFYDLIEADQRAGMTAEAAQAQARFATLRTETDQEFLLEKQLGKDPNNFGFLCKIGSIELDLGELRAARRNLGHAAAINPTDPQLNQMVAKINAAANGLSRDQ